MVRLLLTGGSEFAGEIIRPAGRSLIVSGLIVDPAGVVSDLRYALIPVSEIKEVLAASPLEEEMIQFAREYQPEEAIRPEPPKPPKWRVRFKPPRMPLGAENIEVFFAASLPKKERVEAKAINFNLEKGEAIVQLPATPLGGFIAYESRNRRIRRHLEIVGVEAIESE